MLRSTYSLLLAFAFRAIPAFTAAVLLAALTPLSFAQSSRSANPRPESVVSAAPSRVEVLFAHGGATVFTDRALFDAACGIFPIETFEEANVEPKMSAAMFAPLDSTTNNDIFSPGDILPGFVITVEPPQPNTEELFISGVGFINAPSVQVGGNVPFSEPILTFSPTVDCAGFDIDLNGMGLATSVTAFDASGDSLGSAVVTGFSLKFVGFSSPDAPVASILTGTNASQEYADFDNVTFGDVATTSTDPNDPLAGMAAVASPNPFAGQTAIRFVLDASADVRLTVYDVLGREVAVLLDGPLGAGSHSASFDAHGLSPGTYVYRFVIGTGVQMGRMTLAR